MLVIFSGEICSGKSTVAAVLENQFSFQKISTGNNLREVAEDRGIKSDRCGLQELGDELDIETNFQWIAKLFYEAMNSGARHYYFDSVRKREQLELLKFDFPAATHVHLTAPPDVLEKRYLSRAIGDERDEQVPYGAAKSSETEQQVRLLAEFADKIFDTDKVSASQIATAILET